jgi:hypothetical protein
MPASYSTPYSKMEAVFLLFSIQLLDGKGPDFLPFGQIKNPWNEDILLSSFLVLHQMYVL